MLFSCVALQMNCLTSRFFQAREVTRTWNGITLSGAKKGNYIQGLLTGLRF